MSIPPTSWREALRVVPPERIQVFLDGLATSVDRLRRLLRHVDQQDCDMAVVNDRMVDRQRRLQGVASQIGEGVGDLGDLIGIDTTGQAIIIDAEDQRAAVRVVPKAIRCSVSRSLCSESCVFQSSSLISCGRGMRV